jgi:hypothetical protein
MLVLVWIALLILQPLLPPPLVFFTLLPHTVAKVFLDPLDNEDFTKNSIDMDLGVLIRESNAGSTRWMNSGASLPFPMSQPPPAKSKSA